jgi:hypothetical protein
MKMPKPILYLHIGMPKTGTTALQNFFSINREMLQSHGIHYPLNDVWYMAHHRLGWALNNVQADGYHVDLESPEKEWSNILGENRGRTLISTETLSKCTCQSIQKVKGFVSEYRVKVIIYLRRQDTLVCSQVNQMTKHGSFVWPSSSDIIQANNSQKIIQSWADVFGKENVIVRPYEKGQFYGDAIFSDFLHYVFGLKLTDEFLLPERDHNPRLHRVALEYKRFLNFLPLPMEQKRDALEPLHQYSQQLYSQKRDDFSLLSPSQCLEMIQQYAESNEKIAREYLGRKDGRLFCDPLPDPNEPWKPYPGLLSKDDIKQISRLITEGDPEYATQLGRAIQINLKSEKKDVRAAAKTLAVGLKILKNRRKTSEICKGCCVSAMRFTYRKLPARIQPGLKKVARKLKIVQKSEEGN